MKTLTEVIEKCQENVDLVDRGWWEVDCFLSHEYMVDALHYLKEYRAVTDICHKHGIASVWGQVLPDPEKTDWDKKLYFDNAYDNDPLTWDELKQMEGKPVWVETDNVKFWTIVDNFRTICNQECLCCSKGCMCRSTHARGDWQAYRKERE